MDYPYPQRYVKCRRKKARERLKQIYSENKIIALRFIYTLIRLGIAKNDKSPVEIMQEIVYEL